MAATPYRPISWTDQSLTKEKLQQMANNDQWLFENTPRLRYTNAGVTRDTGIKIIAGKSPFAVSPNDYLDVMVNFGNFFSAACKPIVTAVVETSGGWLRKFVTIRPISGGEIDNRGVIIHITAHEVFADRIEAGGYIHWHAIGF